MACFVFDQSIFAHRLLWFCQKFAPPPAPPLYLFFLLMCFAPFVPSAFPLSQRSKYWRDQLMMITQRVGWLYGYYVDDPNYDNGLRAVVEAIYEPPQIASADGTQMLPDDQIENVDKIAEKLDLERIGWVFTSIGREYTLSAHEVEAIARLQLQFSSSEHYAGYTKSNFVTMHVKPDSTTAEPDTHAFMVSDQAMAMFRDELIGNANHEQEMTIREPYLLFLFSNVLILITTFLTFYTKI